MNKKQAALYLDCSERTVKRYMDNGKLPYVKKINGLAFKKKHLDQIKEQLHKNQDKHHNNPVKPTKTLDLPEPTEHKEDLLDDNGKAELMRVTEILKEEGILDKTHKTLLFKYAFFQQKVIHYMQLLDEDGFEEEDKYHMTKSLDQFQKWVLHYEKELLISTASRLKVFPPKIDTVQEFDEMEALLNG